MASKNQRADFYVKNNLSGQVNVQTVMEGKEKKFSVQKGPRKKIPLHDYAVSLVIEAPGVAENVKCPIKIESDVDLVLTYFRKKSKWDIKIHPTGLGNDVPLNVNVTVGQEEPEKPVPPDPPEEGGEEG